MLNSLLFVPAPADENNTSIFKRQYSIDSIASIKTKEYCRNQFILKQIKALFY